MKYREVLDLIEEGENLHCEFKLRFSSHDKIAKELLAFANTSGGYILFGIDDSKKIVGVQSEKSESELITQAANEWCEPPVPFRLHYFEMRGKEVVVVEVPESDNKPHRLQDFTESVNGNSTVYVRVNDKSIPAGKELIKILQYSSSPEGLKYYHIGELEKKVFSLLEENDLLTAEQLHKAANVSYRRASRAIIKLVRAGILFYHVNENGEEFFSQK